MAKRRGEVYHLRCSFAGEIDMEEKEWNDMEECSNGRYPFRHYFKIQPAGFFLYFQFDMPYGGIRLTRPWQLYILLAGLLNYLA